MNSTMSLCYRLIQRVVLYGSCVASISFLHAQSKRMEETGFKAPENFVYFELPVEALKTAKKYLPPNPIIVDAGAYNGNESVAMAKFWPRGHVHAFEPVSQIYHRLVATAKQTPNVTTYNLALGANCEKLTMFLSHEDSDADHISMSSSLYPPKDHLIYSGTKFKGKETVDVITLDAWAKQKGITKVDMLWLDMQGYELPALKASPNILKGVSVILTELEFVEAYEGQPLYHEVKKWLEEQGFVLIAGNFTFPKAKTLWFGDGLFVRSELLK